MVLTTATRAKTREADKRWIWKLCFRAAATVFSIVGIGCTAWAVSENAHLADTTQQAFWLVLGFSIIWNIINFIVLLARNKPIHPGANVGCDLILWIAYVVTGVIAAFGVDQDVRFEGNFRYYYCYSDYPGARSGETCPGFNSCDDALGVLKQRGEVEAAGVAFAFAAMILHFALFVAACIDVHALKRVQDEQRAVKVAETIIAGMEKRGQLPYQQQPPYQPAQDFPQQHPYNPPVQPINQPAHHSIRQSMHQPPFQPINQPIQQQVQQSTSPVNPEMTQVQLQRSPSFVDAIESHETPHGPERIVGRDEASTKGRTVLGLS
ncbi:MAG: hypothetical protein M1835_000707 [Candelina submexicana]|nr:MAG: hypothetical protein M1835_000707 [Candelina submexicana]